MAIMASTLPRNSSEVAKTILITGFNGIYGQKPQLIQGGALLTLIAPPVLLLLAQRFFVQGIVITGVEK
jgi:ABC-type glycerol-3-phosphate transport system permease component